MISMIPVPHNKEIANLIPLENVNATALYEALHADWRWYYNELRLGTGTPVSADNCTALTWDAYEQAKIDGQALLDELYDTDGDPTSVNTSDRNDEVNAAAAAADGHTILERIFKLDAANLTAQSKVTVKLVPQGDFLAVTSDTGAAQYGKPNQNKITHTYRDGHKDTNASGYCYRYDEGYQPSTSTWEQPAHPGDVLSIWRYLKTSNTLYWPAWSTDETTWHALTKTTLYDIHGGAYPDYYISDITIPETAEDGSEFTVYLKMIDKATYDALDVVDEDEIAKLRNAAIAERPIRNIAWRW